MNSSINILSLLRKREIELVVNEIFYSIQGESSRVGLPTVFIRLTGCPLRCQYCDTEYAFFKGKKMKMSEILNKIKNYSTRYITVTGGEPLAQKSCLILLKKLCDIGYDVSLETSGAIDVSKVDKRIKTPASKEENKNKYENLNYLTSEDEIKFVICNRSDYVWAKEKIIEKKISKTCEIIFSPVHESLSPEDLADWIIEDQLNARMQIQLHKHIWGNKPGK